jgi:hypothetical protein
MLATVLTLLQCSVHLLLKILYTRKGEGGQICLHRISFSFPAFKQVHTGSGDECFHIGQSLFGDHNLMINIMPMKDKRSILSCERKRFG